jgi:signal transduction histidine kinase
MLTHHSIALIIVCITHFVLSCFVYAKGQKQLTNITYSLYSLAIATWSGLEAFAILSTDHNIALRLWRLNHIGVIFIPIFFVHFVTSLLEENAQKERRNVIRLSYLSGLFFLFFNMKGELISEVVPKGYFNYFINPGPTYKLFFVLWVFWAIYGLVELFLLFKRSLPSKRNQLSYFSISMFIAYCGGTLNFLPTFDIIIPHLIAFGTHAISIYAFIAVYAIIAQRLLEIEVVIRRATVFAGLFACAYGTFTVFTIFGQRFFTEFLGWNTWVSLVPTVAVITFSLRPLETILTNLTERYLFQRKYHYKDLLKTFTTEVLTVLNFQSLLDKTVEGLDRIIKLESCSILLLDSENEYFEVRSSKGLVHRDLKYTLKDPLIAYLDRTHNALLRNSEYKSLEVKKMIFADLVTLNAHLCLPIVLHNRLIGVLCMGRKKSGEDYTQVDVEILNSLARTEAIAIANAQMFRELSRTQAEAAQKEKMAVIGTLAAGINHEICNPLGIARGQCEMFLLNYRDGLYATKTDKEIVNITTRLFDKVIYEIDRATGITKRLSSFARPSKKFKFQEVNVNEQVNEVLAILGHELKIGNVQIINEIPPRLPDIVVDPKQFQEVIFNIIWNGAQAISDRGTIRLSANGDNSSQVKIRIKDSGCGIPQEKLNDIFDPFYTTKSPGKGSGLGLFIVKQVVTKNKGVIQVNSNIGKGTEFILTFKSSHSRLATQSGHAHD